MLDRLTVPIASTNRHTLYKACVERTRALAWVFSMAFALPPPLNSPAPDPLAQVANLDVLYLGITLVGFAYGAFWAIGPVLLRDAFGCRSIGILYSVVVASFAIGR